MRVDAARNLAAVLTIGAHMLAADPGVSVVDIAAEAGVDRQTVYRRFANREELLRELGLAGTPHRRIHLSPRTVSARRVPECRVVAVAWLKALYATGHRIRCTVT